MSDVVAIKKFLTLPFRQGAKLTLENVNKMGNVKNHLVRHYQNKKKITFRKISQMKSILLLFLSISMALVSFSQVDTLPVFKRFPYIPEFTIYKAPDSTAFTRENLKRKPSVFIIFSPDCEHCQRETQDLISNIDKFKKMQILMITYLPYEEMIKFFREYKIAKYPIISMGRDAKFFFPIFFKVRNFTSIFVYDKYGKLKDSFEGVVDVNKIVDAL